MNRQLKFILGNLIPKFRIRYFVLFPTSKYLFGFTEFKNFVAYITTYLIPTLPAVYINLSFNTSFTAIPTVSFLVTYLGFSLSSRSAS